MNGEALCGAKTREGTTCKLKPLSNGRCRLHGGNSTGPRDQRGNQNARKHGIYSKTTTKEEESALDLMKLGALDDELAVARLQLRRALIHQLDHGFNTATHLAVDRLLGRIGSLERVRLEIERNGTQVDPVELAKEFHEAILEIEEMLK